MFMSGWGHVLIQQVFSVSQRLKPESPTLFVQVFYFPPLLQNITAGDGGLLPGSCLFMPEFLQPQHFVMMLKNLVFH